MENMISAERRRCRNLGKQYNKAKKKESNAQDAVHDVHDTNIDDITERSAFDIFHKMKFGGGGGGGGVGGS